MTLRNLLALVATILDEVGAPYMLTGSLAGTFHGSPRATRDIDLVVDAPLETLHAMAQRLRRAGLYVSDDAVREAVRVRGMFNAVDPESGWKVDFIVRKDRPFSRTEFDERMRVDFEGLPLEMARPEDVVVAKLEWAQKGDSERQIRDAAEILLVQEGKLDTDRIERWVSELGLESGWARARALAGLRHPAQPE